MGRLQDALYKMKYGTEQKITAALQKPLSLAAKNLQNKLKNEDPEKVKGFLLDLSTSEDMPKEVRNGAKQLLDAVYSGTSTEVVSATVVTTEGPE